MILVLLGTFHIEFKRPLIALEKLCQEGALQEEIVVQNGYTPFSSPYFDMRPFMEPAVLDQLYERARLVITHAGTGSIIKGLKKEKKVIAIPRLHKRGEHIDDHQLEILHEFAQSGYLLPWHEDDSLKTILRQAEDFIPRPYLSRKEHIVGYLKEYLDSL